MPYLAFAKQACCASEQEAARIDDWWCHLSLPPKFRHGTEGEGHQILVSHGNCNCKARQIDHHKNLWTQEILGTHILSRFWRVSNCSQYASAAIYGRPKLVCLFETSVVMLPSTFSGILIVIKNNETHIRHIMLITELRKKLTQRTSTSFF